jgi:hypothetical protein
VSDSRLETTFDSVVLAFSQINTENGFRNTVANVVLGVRPPDQITAFPEIAFELGPFETRPLGSNRDVFDVYAHVFLVATVKSNTTVSAPAQEPLLFEQSISLAHDIQRKIASLMTAYVNDSSNKWNIELKENKLEIIPVLGLGEKRNIGLIQTEFVLHVRALGTTFS